MRALVADYVARFRPLLIAANRAWWRANVTGLDDAFEAKRAAETAIVELHADHTVFAELETLRSARAIDDPVLRRQLEVMYRAFLPGQADPALQKRLVDLENEVEQTFNTHRSHVGGKRLSENDVRAILAESEDSGVVEEAWTAYMAVGAKVASTLDEIVALRNEQARQLGYGDFYRLQLFLQEVDEDALFRVFDELDELTRDPFVGLKREIDDARATRFGVPRSELRPWHFGDLFFQDAPESAGVDLEALFHDRDLLALARDYYSNLGMDVGPILDRSDLYEKAGKSPHAFSVDIDRAGDVRVLCNLKPSLRWMDTLLHELGHAVYDVHIRAGTPFVLRTASNAITTEGCAMRHDDGRHGQDGRVPGPGARTRGRRRDGHRHGGQAEPASREADLQPLGPGGHEVRAESVCRSVAGSGPAVVGSQGPLPAPAAATGDRPPRLRGKGPHRLLSGLLPQLHAGRSVRGAGAGPHRAAGSGRRRGSWCDLLLRPA